MTKVTYERGRMNAPRKLAAILAARMGRREFIALLTAQRISKAESGNPAASLEVGAASFPVCGDDVSTPEPPPLLALGPCESASTAFLAGRSDPIPL
jgi:hypothetical protein